MFTKILLALLMPNLLLTALPQGEMVKGVSVQRTPGWYKTNPLTIEPIISSPSAVVIDGETGQVLFKKNQDVVRPVASISKLMATYMYLQKTNSDLIREITLKPSDERNGGKKFIFKGDAGTADDFLNVALIGSDNSAITALARSAQLLENYKEEARRVSAKYQLTNTSFIEPTGLDARNTSTALEIARLANIVWGDKHIAEISAKKQYDFVPKGSSRKRVIISTNDLLNTNVFTITAGKTGYTKEAGYSLVTKAIDHKGKEIIITVLGAPTEFDRFADAKALGYWIFENFE